MSKVQKNDTVNRNVPVFSIAKNKLAVINDMAENVV